MMILTFRRHTVLLPFCTLFFAVSVFASGETTRQVRDTAAPLKLFLIGNSFSQNATRYLPQLAAAGGQKLVIGRAELGGCPLQRHWETVEAARRNPDDPKGKPYGGKSLETLLASDDWDVVTIQQYSLISSDVDTYRPYAQKLVEFIHAIRPKAKIVVHQTWAYRSDADGFGRAHDTVTTKSEKEMYEKSRAAYHTIAKELGLEIIPTGDAFYRVDSDPRWAFKKDTRYNYAAPTYPELPNQVHSLHAGYTWDKAKKLAFDSHHASVAGCYLGGLVWYRFLFGQPAARNSFKPAEVDDQFAAHLKTTADQVVKKPKAAMALR